MTRCASQFCVLLLVGVAFTGCLGWASSEQSPTENPPQSNDLNFVGDLTADSTFTLEGQLTLSTENAEHTRFDNVSLQLYRDDGTLIASKCYGVVSEETRKEISYTHDEIPEYVVFYSPDFWEADRVYDSSADYFYRYDNENYSAGFAYERSEYPVDVTRHSPCS